MLERCCKMDRRLISIFIKQEWSNAFNDARLFIAVFVCEILPDVMFIVFGDICAISATRNIATLRA